MRKLFYPILILLIIFITSGANAQLQPPVLLQPPDYATNVSLFPTFTWQAVSGATSYKLMVATGPTTVIDVSNITGTSYTVTQALLTGNTFYYWSVKAVNAGGESAWASYFHFTTTVAVPPAPVLVAPVNNATNVSITPLLDWEDVPGATSYRVQISTSPSFGTTVINVGGLTNSAYSVPGGLTNNTTYYWRVNASNSGGAGLWSDVWSFTTVPAAPSAPTLSYPPNGSTGIPVNVTLNWNDVPTATGYRAQVSLNNSFTQIVFDELSSVSQIPVPPGTLSGTTQYYWRVYASNVGGISPWSSVWSFTTAVAPPAAPVLISPPNGSTGIAISGVTFDWNNSAGATSYRIQISTSSDFGTTFVNTVVGSSQYTHNNPPFANNTTYYWRVNATNSGGTGQWSVVWSFTTVIASLPAPTLITPPNSATNVPLTPYMDWSDVSGATSYRLQISTTSSFSSTVLNVVTVNSEYVVPSGILQGYTLYYWRVATMNEGGTGPYSAAWTFTTVQTFNLTLKVFLEGFYNGTTQVPDTIKVLLAQNTSPFSGRDTCLAMLTSNGSITGVSFAKIPSGNYYIVVKHRNHIETWSANPMYFSTGNTVTYDFTNSQSKAYGNNMKQVGTVWVFFGGDANADGFVNAADYELYKVQFGSSGYKACDYNGDSFVDGYDLPIQNNFGVSVKKPQ